jgi:hypothetical protein
MPIVVISRTYLANGHPGEIREATGQEEWEALLNRLRDRGLTPEPFRTEDGTDGVTVECPGLLDARDVHGIACAYRALPVIS